MVPTADKECILAVDDAPDTLELIERRLTANGYRRPSASWTARRWIWLSRT